MAKDEFSVNELEPERNNSNIQETTQTSKKRVSDATLLNQEAMALEEKKAEEQAMQEESMEAEEYQGPTIKEVIVNSVNPDYQGPTAKEMVVNSVKVDNTKKKNYVGLFVLIFVLLAIGIIASLEIFSKDGKKKNINYLEGMPEWVSKYNEYFKEEYKDIVAYNVAFLDFDFDDKPEAIVNYKDGDKTLYKVVDCIDDVFIDVGEISNILMFYSFDKESVIWYINTSMNDLDMNLIDLRKRLLNQSDYEIVLTLDSLSQFKSNHFTLSYQIKYTKISFRTMEENLAEAVKLYDKEKDNVDNIISNTIEKYSGDI